MQSVSSRIWTRVAVCISYDDNHYATVTRCDLIIIIIIIDLVSFSHLLELAFLTGV